MSEENKNILSSSEEDERKRKAQALELTSEGISKDTWFIKWGPEASMADVLRRIWLAESEIERDKNEIQRIEQLLTSKLDWNKDLVSIILAVAVFTILWLAWQSFWMYPQMIKDYAEKSGTQNTKIELQNNQIEELKDDISEIKGRIDKEVDRRIILENNVKKNVQ